MKNFKNVAFVLIVLGIIAFVSCEKTTTPEPPKPVEPTFTLSLNGAVQSATFSGANISYQLNTDTVFAGTYRITLSVAANIGGANNLNFSVWCYDIHNPTPGGIRAKKYFIEPSRCDCRAYNDTTLCDGSNLSFNIAETVYNNDATDVNSYINITSCDAKAKLLAGNVSVKTVASNDANNIQIVTIAFSNISYTVLN